MPDKEKTIHTCSCSKTIYEILKHMDQPVVVIDENGVIVQVNQQACKLFQYTSNELLDQKIEILVPQKIRDKHIKLRNKYFKATHVNLTKMDEVQGITKNNQSLTLDIIFTHYEGELGSREIALISDVGAKKRINTKLSSLVSKIEKINGKKDNTTTPSLFDRCSTV